MDDPNSLDSLSATGGLPMDGRLPDLQCAVCNQRGHGCHFGVVACRPCAAFFRRCIAENRSYKCLRGTNNCDIRRDGQRNACKSCRLRLCRLVGMVYNSASVGDKESNNSNIEPGMEGMMASGSRQQGANDNRQPGQQQQESLSDGSSHPRLELHLEESGTPTLALLIRANNAFIAGQRSLFMALHPEAAFQSLPLIIPKHSEFVRMDQGTKPLLFGMLNDAIEPFAQMEHQMKLTLLDASLRSLKFLHGCHLTMAQFPTPGDTRYMVAVGHMLDSRMLDQWMAEWTVNMENPEEYIRVKRPLMEKLFSFIDSFRRLPVEVCQQDFCALLVVTLWNIAQTKFGYVEESWRVHKETVLAEWLLNMGSRSVADPVPWSPAIQMSRLICQLVELNVSQQQLGEEVHHHQPRGNCNDNAHFPARNAQ